MNDFACKIILFNIESGLLCPTRMSCPAQVMGFKLHLLVM